MDDKQKYLNENFIGRWISGVLTEEEKLHFDDWLSKNTEYKNEFDEYSRIWNQSGKISLKPGKTAKERWENINSQLNETRPTPKKIIKFKNIRNFSYFAVAASIILAISLWNNINNSINILTPKGKQVVHHLPDGSNITLNAETKIEYNSKNWEANRFVKMSGEAFFEVRPGNEFVVYSDNVKTTVLGTSFNINTRSNEVEVACITGKIKVQNQSSDESSVVLTPGLLLKAPKDGSKTKTEKFNINKKTGWMNGDFYFSNVPLEKVFFELERQFNIQIKYDEKIGDQSFTGHFNHKNMQNAIEIISLAAGLNFSFENESIVLIYSAE